MSSTHGRGGVDCLGHRNEGAACGVKALHKFCKVGQRTGQPVDLVDHHHLDVTRVNIVKQALHRRPDERASGDATIVIAGHVRNPAIMPLAGDVGCTGLVLGVERVEVLVSPSSEDLRV